MKVRAELEVATADPLADADLRQDIFTSQGHMTPCHPIFLMAWPVHFHPHPNTCPCPRALEVQTMCLGGNTHGNSGCYVGGMKGWEGRFLIFLNSILSCRPCSQFLPPPLCPRFPRPPYLHPLLVSHRFSVSPVPQLTPFLAPFLVLPLSSSASTPWLPDTQQHLYNKEKPR